MSDISANIFVVGDLIIDHAIFVKELSGAHQQYENDPVYEVIRRMDTAGGTAHTARILAVLNSGRTFLWGIIGESNWGSFRSILEKSQAADGPGSNVGFRGIQDETHARMNTITRLIKVENPSTHSNPRHIARFDDYGHVHVSDDKRLSVLYHLERTYDKHSSLDAIVINDFDMNSLSRDLITKIAEFANSKSPQIPLFLDPKHTKDVKDKYTNIEGTAILPNLAEWCYLVGERKDRDLKTWKARLDHEDDLTKMAQLSFKYLGNFKYHIIKCGNLGFVILAPHPKAKDKYAVYRVMPHIIPNSMTPHQLGCGDVMTGIIAMEFANSEQKTEDMLKAFQKANAVVACYRNMPWQRMPSREFVTITQEKLVEPELKAEPSKGILFLPKTNIVKLLEYETVVKGLFSADKTYQDRIKEVIKDLQDGWSGGLTSIILGAPTGSGKSTMIDELKAGLGESIGITVFDASEASDKDSPSTIEINWGNTNLFIRNLSKNSNARTDRIVVVIDEALEPPMGEMLTKYGLGLLNSAHANHIRFIFIDADFKPVKELPVNSEFTGRCRSYYLPSLEERPIDIPYIVASVVLRKMDSSHYSVKFEGQFLTAIINATLSNPNSRFLVNWANEGYEKAIIDWNGIETLTLKYEHLPKEILNKVKHAAGVPNEYEFYRAR
jgi:sugar/nucleoside kinase (ribokinase family)